MSTKIRLRIAEHAAGIVAIDLTPGAFRQCLTGPTCPHCNGRGVLVEAGDILGRCDTCEATGLALDFDRGAA